MCARLLHLQSDLGCLYPTELVEGYGGECLGGSCRHSSSRCQVMVTRQLERLHESFKDDLGIAASVFGLSTNRFAFAAPCRGSRLRVLEI